jgi:hypothetical protein
MKIDLNAWYPARKAADMLELTEETVKKHCRIGELKSEAKQRGPKKQWHVKGSSIIALRKKWRLD